MADMEQELRRLYGYPEDMTYDQYAASRRSEAERLVSEGRPAEAAEIYRSLADSIKGDREACEALGRMYLDGTMPKDPWKSMLYYTAAMSPEGDRRSAELWSRLGDFRGILLRSRPLGVLRLNGDDAESACCGRMLDALIAGSVSLADVPEGAEPEFSMTMTAPEFKSLKLKGHEVMPTPGGVSVMDLKACPYCGAKLTVGGRSAEWRGFIDTL